MKKNLIFAALLVSVVLAVGLVSAGWLFNKGDVRDSPKRISKGDGIDPGGHTHLVDYEVVNVQYVYNNQEYELVFANAFNNPNLGVIYPSVGFGNGEGRIMVTQSGTKLLQFRAKCPLGKSAIAGGYALVGEQIFNSAAVVRDNVFAGDTYDLVVEEPFTHSGSGSNVRETDAHITGARLQVSCARLEPAEGDSTPHF